MLGENALDEVNQWCVDVHQFHEMWGWKFKLPITDRFQIPSILEYQLQIQPLQFGWCILVHKHASRKHSQLIHKTKPVTILRSIEPQEGIINHVEAVPEKWALFLDPAALTP